MMLRLVGIDNALCQNCGTGTLERTTAFKP